jgi:hypothetical protein
VDNRQIELMYETDREAALKALKDAGLEYRETMRGRKDDAMEDWKKAQGSIRRTFEEITDEVSRAITKWSDQTATELVGRGGLGTLGDKLGKGIGEMFGKGLQMGFRALSPEAAGAGMLGMTIAGLPTVLGLVGEQVHKSFARYEAYRMLGAKMAPVMRGGGKPGMGDSDFYQMGTEYTSRSNEIRGMTGESTRAINDVAQQLSRVGIGFDEAGKHATAYALSADRVLNVQRGMTAALEVEAVTKYGEAWEDVTKVIKDTTGAREYFAEIADQTRSANDRSLASNQTLLEMFKSVRESTKGASYNMVGLNRLFLNTVDTMRHIGLRPQAMNALAGEFLSRIAPTTTGMNETIMQGAFLKDALQSTREGRMLLNAAFGLAEKQGIHPLMFNIAMDQILSQDQTGAATTTFGTAVLEGIMSLRDSIQGASRPEQNAIMMNRMQLQLHMSPKAAVLGLAMGQEYEAAKGRGLSPQEAAKSAVETNEVQSLAGAMGMKGMSFDQIMQQMTLMGGAGLSAEAKLGLATEKFTAIHQPDAFWGHMTASIKGGLADVIRVAGSDMGSAALPAIGILPHDVRQKMVEALVGSEETKPAPSKAPPQKDAGRSPRKIVTGSYTKSTCSGLEQVSTCLSDDYFGTGDPADAIMHGIAGAESGGTQDPYRALGKIITNPKSKHYGTRAYGKYQVMEKNIGPWTEEALGYRMTPDEFLADPGAQEKVTRHQVENMLKEGLSPGQVAKRWIGPGSRDLGTGISTEAYIGRVLGGMRG